MSEMLFGYAEDCLGCFRGDCLDSEIGLEIGSKRLVQGLMVERSSRKLI